jgi:hypothetical protein
MNQMIGDTFTVKAICELCGKVDELRPYGPKGERICFDCGQKDDAMVRMFQAMHNRGFSSN